MLTVMCGGDEDAYAGAEPVIAAYARMCKLLGPAGSGQLTKMVNQICIAGLVAGPVGRHSFRQEGRARRRRRDRDDLQGRGAILADGKPLQDDERRQVRFRLCRRMDAQGPRRSASPKRAATARACRSPRWSISSTRKSRRWAASAGIRRACWRGWSAEGEVIAERARPISIRARVFKGPEEPACRESGVIHSTGARPRHR